MELAIVNGRDRRYSKSSAPYCYLPKHLPAAQVNHTGFATTGTGYWDI